jgi:MFS family permease
MDEGIAVEPSLSKAAEPAAAAPAVATGSPMLNVLRGNNFRLLWMGQGLSMLGDQFAFIALPWLVLSLTGDPLALAGTMALAGIPRAIIMLIGGAVTDRFSSRLIMIASDLVRLVLIGVLGVLVVTGTVQLWMIYAVSVIFGIVDGFFGPASGAMMPQVVRPDELPAGNALYSGTAQLINFLGPMLAGGLIAVAGHALTGGTGNTSGEMSGIAAALLFDTLTFAVSIATLWMMRGGNLRGTTPATGGPGGPEMHDGLLSSIKTGFLFLWNDALLRPTFLLMVATNFIFIGPMSIGLPVMANTRMAGGAAAFGVIMGAYAAGNLLGYLLSGALPPKSALGTVLIALLAAFGVGGIALGFVRTAWLAFLILFIMGIGNGYIGIILISWLQKRTPIDLLGRVMGMVMFAGIGLAPLSQALTGVAIKISFSGLFVLAGGLMLVVMVVTMRTPALRHIEM